ncbi:MAG: hypothetical protein R3E93_00885 [Thiothrix sp.]
MFKKNKIALSVAVGVIGAVGIMTSAQAVHVNPDGTGQVLLFPYYNAKENYVTNINLVNSTEQTKAVRIKFRESKHSKDMFDFNIYMSPNDVWTGTLRQSAEPDENGKYVASLRTTDRSCTLPVRMAATCADGKCETIQNFHGYQYYKDASGSPMLDASDTQEGYIEVIEMGVVTDPGVQADVVHEDGEPVNCKALEKKYWASNGIFTLAPTRDQSQAGISAPTGGLFGETAVLNLQTGTSFAVEPVAIDNYTNSIEAQVSPGYKRFIQKLRTNWKYVPQHTRPDDDYLFDLPSLASGDVTTSNILRTGVTGAAEMVVTTWKQFDHDPSSESELDVSGNPVKVSDPPVVGQRIPGDSPDNNLYGDDDVTTASGVNPYPIAHILATNAVMNEYFLDPTNSYNGHTDWVVTFPMKKYGVAWKGDLTGSKTSLDTVMTDRDEFDEPLSTDSTQPVIVREMSLRDKTTVYARVDGFDREEQPLGCDGSFGFSPPILADKKMCDWTELEREVNVINFRTTDNEYDSSYSVLSGTGQIEESLPPRRVLNVGPYLSGWARLSFPGYDLSAYHDGATTYGPGGSVNPLPTSEIYQGVPVIGAAFISGKVVEGNADEFGNAIPHKYNRTKSSVDILY